MTLSLNRYIFSNLTFFFALSLGISPAPLRSQQKLERSESPEPAVVQIDFMLERVPNSDGVFQATGDMGGLNAGARMQLQLNIINPFDQDISFGKFGSSCACSDVQIQDDLVFKAKSRKKMTLNYLAPNIAERGKLKIEFNFTDETERKRVCTLRIEGHLMGVIDMGRPRHTIEIENEVTDYHTEIYYTSPITPDSLELELCSKLRDVLAKITEGRETGVANVVLTVPHRSLPVNGITGNVMVKHNPSGTSGSFEITLVPFRQFVISPSWLHFRLDKSQQRYLASGILLVKQEKHKNNEVVGVKANADQDIPKVSAFFLEKSIDVEISEMGRGYWRLKFTASNSDGNQELIETGKSSSNKNVLRVFIASGSNSHETIEFEVPFFIGE